MPATVRTSTPALPSGRSAASTSQAAWPHIRMSAPATLVALASAAASSSPPSALRATGSATNTTSTSLT
jgi:hypothetical protein